MCWQCQKTERVHATCRTNLFLMQPLKESKIYTEDRIGLKTLDESGRLIFINVPGADHVVHTDEWFIQNIIPYLNTSAA